MQTRGIRVVVLVVVVAAWAGSVLYRAGKIERRRERNREIEGGGEGEAGGGKSATTATVTTAVAVFAKLLGSAAYA